MANRQQTIIGVVAGVLVAGGATWLLWHHHSGAVTAPLAHHPSPRISETANPSAGSPTNAPLMMPVSGKLIAHFGWQYSGALNEWYYNPGLTIAAPAGTPVRAAWSGTVTQVSKLPHMGLSVTIADGDSFQTVYGHLGSVSVKTGDHVQQGQPIGTVGGASLYSRQPGAHVDFQVYHGSTATDPMNYLHPSS